MGRTHQGKTERIQKRKDAAICGQPSGKRCWRSQASSTWKPRCGEVVLDGDGSATAGSRRAASGVRLPVWTDVPSLLRALRHRNYRLFFGGQSVSLVGTWITRIATSWLVYRLTGSALLLGLVGFCGQIPTLLLAPFAGVLVDRWDRAPDPRRHAGAVDACSRLALAVLTLGRHHHGRRTSCVLQVVPGRHQRVRHAGAPGVRRRDGRGPRRPAERHRAQLVDGQRQPHPRPVDRRRVIAAVGEAWCFAARRDVVPRGDRVAARDAARRAARAAAPRPRACCEELATGFRYVTRLRADPTALLLLALVSTMGMPYTVLMPAIAAEACCTAARTRSGFLMTASGLGALGGALYLASRRTVVGLGRVIAIASAGCSASGWWRSRSRGRSGSRSRCCRSSGAGLW